MILLSWKEDFLQRMRDLHAGARGYLRKEAGTAQILARVRQVLRPRARVEEQLRGGGEVRGRTEGLGVVGLLRAVSALRPDARVTVRDAWNLYEVDLRGGDVVDLTCTATDGAFLRGPRALPQLLGVTSARFTVDTSKTQVMETVKEPIDKLLSEGCARLGAVVDSVSGRALPVAARLELDDDALDSFLRTSPAPIEDIVRRLRAGSSPRDLLMGGEVAPGNLESALIDLARRGAIRSVRGVDGEDRVAVALEARRDGRDVESELPIQPQELVAERADAGEIQAGRQPAGAPDATQVDIHPRGAILTSLAQAMDAPRGLSGAGPQSPEVEFKESEDDFLSVATEPRPRDSVPSLAELGSQYPPPPSRGRKLEPVVAEPVQTADASLLSPAKAPPAVNLARMADSVAAQKPGADATAEDDEPSMLGWVTMLVIFGVVGFIGMSVLSRACGSTNAISPEPAEPSVPTATTPVDAGAAAQGARRAAPVAEPDELSYGQTLDTIDAGAGVNVAPNQGLLVIEAGPGRRPQVFLGSRSLGRVPIREVLPEGRHELRFRRGDEDSFRFIYVQAGKTRIIPPL